MRRYKKGFTLLEVMIAILLIAAASGIVALNMRKAIHKKRFYSDLERLRTRFAVSQRMAIAMQADWKAVLKQEGKGWILETVCEEVAGKKLAPLHLDEIDIFFNGKKVREQHFDFFSTGLALPEGNFLFVREEEKKEWKAADFFYTVCQINRSCEK